MTIYLTSCTAPKVSLLGTCYHFIISSWTWEMLKRFKKSKRRNVWVHDISKRSYQIASRNKLQEFNQPETKVVIHHTWPFFFKKKGGSPLSRKRPFFLGTGTLLAEDTAMNNRERLNPGDPSGETSIHFQFSTNPSGFFDGLCMHLNWFTSFGQGSVLLLKPKLLVPPVDAPLVLWKSDLFQCFPLPCRQTCRPKLSSKNWANGQMIHKDFWQILLVQEHPDGSQKHQDSDPGK